MAIDAQGWVSWAFRRPGPANKVYQQTNQQLGLALHSVEGWLSGALGELDKPNRQASWHFTNDLGTGSLYQHYPLSASTWTSGSVEANTRYLGLESCGVAGTPLDSHQVDRVLRLIADLEKHWGLELRRPDRLREHKELVAEFGGGATACPSGRYQPLYDALEEDMGMTPEQIARLERVERIIGGDAANDDDLHVSVNNLNDVLTDHIADHGAVTGTGLPGRFKANIEVIP